MAVRATTSRLHSTGFTLIELLVAIGVMALMAGLTWRGIDGIARTQERVQARADKILTLQAGLAQWTSDLDAIQQIPGFDGIDWDGRALRLTRHTSADLGAGLIVVAWARRDIAGTGHWIRWQSPAVTSREQMQAAWARAAQWGQNPSEADKRFEVVLTALQEWRIFYYRGDTWSNPLSSDTGVPPPPPPSNAAPGTNPAALPALAGATVPDGIRVVLTLPRDGPVAGTLTRDWIRPNLGGGKS